MICLLSGPTVDHQMVLVFCLTEGRYFQLLVEPGEGVVFPFVGGSAPVVQDQAVFASRVGEGHPLPRPDLSHPKLGLHLFVPEMIDHTIKFH